MNEYEVIVEFSFNPRQRSFVVRFLSGESYVLSVTDLPKKMQTRSPQWDKAVLSPEKTALFFAAGERQRQIQSHLIHSKGKLL